MRRKTLILLTVLLSVWLAPEMIFAQPSIHGTLSGSYGPGTYIVDGNLTVPAGQTVTIVPGTTFLHTGHFSWSVYGNLQAIGTEDQPIQMLRQQPISAHCWAGIRYQTGATNENRLEYVVIDNCNNNSSPYYGGGIYSNGVDATFINVKISNCTASSGGGIYATGGADITVDHCMIIKNQAGNGAGIYLINSGGAQIKNSFIARNKSTST